MPEFRYVALTDRGQEVHGRAEGVSVRDVASSLRGRSLFVVRLEPAGAAAAPGATSSAGGINAALVAIQSWFSMQLPVRTRDRVFFYQQLALMLRTGLTLLQALEVAGQQSSRGRLTASVNRLTAAIESGKSFSQAMLGERQQFSTLAIKLVETAEASGELDRVLDQVAVLMERRADTKRKLLTAMMYPSIVVVSSIGVATFLVMGIIPKFAAFFARRQAALPWSTQVLVDLSDTLGKYGLPILAGVITALVTLVVAYCTKPGRLTLDRAVLSLPVVGKLLTTGAMAQFSQTMSMMLQSGVTLLESLRISGSVLGNRAISRSVAAASDQILRGQDLTSSLRDPLIPRLVTQVVAVGERTGSLSQVLEELSVFYDKQMQASIQRMSALIEPVMTLVIGGMVGFVYFAFFQAIFQLASAGR